MEVKLSNLTKVFNKDTVAVDHFTTTIPSGKLIGLLGPSGCGKSTTLYMISGLLDPTEGSIHFGDQDVTRLAAEKRGIGLVFQNYALYPHMTVFQNIMFPLENLNITRGEAIERTHKIAKLVQISELLGRKPAQLSGGQQQRVAIARALVKNPRVLLLDEPLSNLDARLRLQTREEIKRIQKETGITTIFVTHDQEEAMSISDIIVVMKDGVLQQMDKPQDVYKFPKNKFVAEFLGNPPINILSGEVKSGKVIINGVAITDTKAADGSYDVGIRPEDFRVDLNGFDTTIVDEETVGRDTLIRFNVKNSKVLRALVNSDDVAGLKTIKLSIKPGKVHLFDVQTGAAVYGK